METLQVTINVVKEVSRATWNLSTDKYEIKVQIEANYQMIHILLFTWPVFMEDLSISGVTMATHRSVSPPYAAA